MRLPPIQKSFKNRSPYLFAFLLAIISMLLALLVGSVGVSPGDIGEIISHQLFGTPTGISASTIGMIWNMRFPRVLLAFLVGALLSISGVVMQSVMQNSLASSYTLGVSSGAAFGVALFLLLNVPAFFLGPFFLPVVGLFSGVLATGIAVGLSSRFDRQLGNQTVVLVGMVVSLFVNGMLAIVLSFSQETLQKITYWQMGSFSLKDWRFVQVLSVVLLVGLPVLMLTSRELDNLTFGDDAAKVTGINVKWMKRFFLFVSSALTGCSIALVGVIGFVDLVAPHIVRQVFGSNHRIVLPMSALFGGTLMVLADLVARTVISPFELPIGAVTAVIGAPFFMYIYFKGRPVS